MLWFWEGSLYSGAIVSYPIGVRNDFCGVRKDMPIFPFFIAYFAHLSINISHNAINNEL